MGVALGLGLGLGLLLILTRSAPRSHRVRQGTSWIRRRNEMLRQAGLEKISALQLIAVQVMAGLLFGAVVLVLSHSIAVSASFAIIGFFGPSALVRRMHLRRRTELREVWPEVVDNLTSAVRAGLSLAEALAALGVRGPEVLRPQFARFAVDYRSSGRFVECLDRLKADLADPVGDRICESLRMAREVGGTDLGRLLRTLSAFLREDARTRAELETRQGWAVNAARLAVAAPWLVLLMLASQTTTLDAYDSTAGALLLAIGGGACVVAYRLMLRIGRLPQERRVLR